ncbi:Calcium-binding protein KIC [Hibiscus syriacus]|uniref:Calcium-binding protein KIC n=1 Tax=Hibiscus syriacus TaxID=106335 RepID=A0A6A2WL94_HIBSY|nr:calcium-binding protein PBP1-like [Hibiscus syriacus]KAE8660268.1 Calcium-binding protein KIC [Hibiscus syriacus]
MEEVVVDFEDYFPSMMERYGEEGLLMELYKGFRLLMDGERGLITFESLRNKSVALGLSDLKDEEIVCMLSEGDLDGDGALNHLEFCFLMIRLSPALFLYAP